MNPSIVGFSLDSARERVRAGLSRAADGLAAEGLPTAPVRGKLLRPMLAWALVPPRRRVDLDERFWTGALAVQMVHEASLLHDDILDDAGTRRGSATEAARRGIGPALVAGDHLLTASYRAALRTDASSFLRRFIEAVERTVAGESEQGRTSGEWLDEEQYLEILDRKSGALFGAAATLAPVLLGIGDPDDAADLGRRMGRLYQMVDDILDYCPHAGRGKPAFQDHRQGKWTLPLAYLEPGAFREPPGRVRDRLFSEVGGPAPMAEVLERIRRERREIEVRHRALAPGDGLVPRILARWIGTVEAAVGREAAACARDRTAVARGSPTAIWGTTKGRLHGTAKERASSGDGPGVLEEARALGGPEGWKAHFRRHARSFHFAARLLTDEQREAFAGVYAFCRFTDDLVDGDPSRPAAERRARLETWRALTRGAWSGEKVGVPLLEAVLPHSRDAGVPLTLVEELLDGVAMDLEPRRYDSLAELRVYSHRVAAVVGEWLTRLLGIRDVCVLERARSLGHAMQLTNILRDVGEDWRNGRLYLPRDRMAAHGVTEAMLAAMAMGAEAPGPGYRALMEELMAEADADYARARIAIPALPRRVRWTVAVAARVYRGIHREIRRNGHDNLRRRAHTTGLRKLVLGLLGVSALAGGHVVALPERPGPRALPGLGRRGAQA